MNKLTMVNSYIEKLGLNRFKGRKDWETRKQYGIKGTKGFIYVTHNRVSVSNTNPMYLSGIRRIMNRNPDSNNGITTDWEIV